MKPIDPDIVAPPDRTMRFSDPLSLLCTVPVLYGVYPLRYQYAVACGKCYEKNPSAWADTPADNYVSGTDWLVAMTQPPTGNIAFLHCYTCHQRLLDIPPRTLEVSDV